MKKITALFLSLVMLCMLTIPALAVGTEYEDYLADFDRWWEDEWDYGLTFEEYLEYSGFASADALKEYFYEYWLDGVPERNWKEDYLAAHPGAMDQFRANAYDYFEEYYYYYDSAEEYMEWWGLTEAEFVEEMAKNQLDDLFQADLERLEKESELRALGGVPGQLNVMVNGRFVEFPDAVPQIVNDRTMVPLRPIMETLGVEVVYRGEDVVCTMDGAALTFTYGSNEAIAEYTEYVDGGDESITDIITMDCAPYIKDDRTYIPVRFFAEAFGYAVGWDDVYGAAVITDTQALADTADEAFTILNRVIADQAVRLENGQSYHSTLAGDMTCTLLDSLNGDTVLTASLTADFLHNSDSLSGSGTFTLSDTLLDLILADEDLDPAEEELTRSALSNGDVRFILNADGEAWLRSTLLETAYEGAGDVWCAIPVDTDVSPLFAMDTSTVTIGTAVAEAVDVNSISGWSDAQEVLEQLAALFGDDRFVKENGVDTLRMGAAELAPDSDEGDFQELELVLTVDASGAAKLSLVMQTSSQGIVTPSMRVEMEYNLSTGEAALTALVHISNVMKLELTLTGTSAAVDQAPLSRPPEGEPVLESAMIPLS